MQIWEELESDPDRGAVALVSTYADRLYRLAYRLCSNSATAEDLAFRTLSRALTSVGRDFGDEKAFFAWLCTILVNFYRQDLRRKGANALVFPETLPEVTDTRVLPDAEICARSDHETLRAVVADLSPLLREATVLRYFEDLSIPEIAEILGVPEGTVKFRLHAARQKIRQVLTKRFGF